MPILSITQFPKMNYAKNEYEGIKGLKLKSKTSAIGYLA